MKTLIEIIRAQATDLGHRTAYTFLEDGPLRVTASRTWSEMDERARAIAGRRERMFAHT